MVENLENDHKPSPLPFHLTIGVTGHRNVENQTQVFEMVKRVLRILIDTSSTSARTPVHFDIISPLAEGADRLVVGACREVDSDCRLKVVLPLEKSDYLEDFKTQESKEEFEQLLSYSMKPLLLRDIRIDTEIPLEKYPDLNDFRKEVRRQAYEDVGRFVVDHCDVLIAIWDKEPHNGRGGTGHIVRYAEKTKCPTIIINPVNPKDNDFTKVPKIPKEDYQKLDYFNTILETIDQKQKYINNVYNELFGKNPTAEPNSSQGSQETIPEPLKKLVKQYLIPYYVAASSPAKTNQGIYKNAGLAVFWLAFLAVCLVGTGVIFWHAHPYVFLAESFILAIISFIIFYADRKRSAHKNWREFRFLTERIRSAFFCSMGNARPKPFFIKRHTDGENTNVAWMMMATEEICHRLPLMRPLTLKECRQVSEFISEKWIDGQRSYLKKRLKTNFKRLERIEQAGKGLFYFALAVALCHFAIPLMNPEFHHGWVARVMTLLALTLPALAATMEAILYHREYKRLVNHFDRLERKLAGIRRKFVYMTPEKLTEKLIEMDTVMLEESHEWFNLMHPAELHPVL